MPVADDKLDRGDIWVERRAFWCGGCTSYWVRDVEGRSTSGLDD